MFEIELLGTVITEEIEEIIETAQNLSINFDIQKIPFYSITFYEISNISPFFYDGVSLLSSGGFEYIIVSNYFNLKEEIRKTKITQTFN